MHADLVRSFTWNYHFLVLSSLSYENINVSGCKEECIGNQVKKLLKGFLETLILYRLQSKTLKNSRK